jgi:dipeptidase E
VKRLVLFSQPSPAVFEKLKTVLFPEFTKNKICAYMSAEGDNTEANNKYNPVWKEYIERNGAKFILVDNSKRGSIVSVEEEKLIQANILLISGGNTFKLLNHLRLSGLNQAIKDFWIRDNVVLAGFSAGAIVLTPSIETARAGDPNELGVKDLTGLGIVRFEVWPHYDPSQKIELEKIRSNRKIEIKTIGNDEVITIDVV